MDFFTRDGDESRLKNAQLADCLDLVYSERSIGPWGPELVAVAQHNGAHVCWYCMEIFNSGRSQRRAVEVRHGYALILMHAGCIGKKPRTVQVVNDLIRGHQLRREATKIVKGSAALETASGMAGEPLALGDDIFASARNLLAKANESAAAEGYVLPEGPSDVDDAPLIVLAEGLDTVSPRETLSVDDGDNGAA